MWTSVMPWPCCTAFPGCIITVRNNAAIPFSNDLDDAVTLNQVMRFQVNTLAARADTSRDSSCCCFHNPQQLCDSDPLS